MAASPPLRHVAMLPFMAKGHAMPLLQLARLLLSRRLASAVTFFTTPRNAPFIGAGLAGTSAAVVELPFPSGTDVSAPQSMDELPSSDRLVDFLSAVAALRPAFAAALASVQPRPDLLVHDGFLLWATDVADELAVPRLVTLGMGGFASYVSRAVMEQRPHAGLRSPSDPFAVHGLPASLQFTRAEFTPPFDDPEPAGPHWEFVSESCRRMYSSRGIIANSFGELDSAYIDLWNREFDTRMWSIGPLCPAVSESARPLERDISDWLDARLAMGRPVLYVAFGSQAELSRAQLEEIAVGLDRSGVDFLWVIRSKWFTTEDRIKDRFGDRGKVVEGFIDQLGVLSHDAVKGFFTHCGWNSVLESISMGVPILAFPLAAEQKLNAKFLVDVVHIGLRVKDDVDHQGAGGLVASGDLEVLTRELIFGEEGKRAAARVSELSVSSREALEVGGSSFENLELMVRQISGAHAR